MILTIYILIITEKSIICIFYYGFYFILFLRENVCFFVSRYVVEVIIATE